MTHAQHTAEHPPMRPCTCHDLNFGGECFNCGHKPDPPNYCPFCETWQPVDERGRMIEHSAEGSRCAGSSLTDQVAKYCHNYKVA